MSDAAGSPTDAAPRRYAKGEARRGEVLEAAVDVFATAGYRGSGLREVAARAGISYAGVRHYFPTKLDLLHAVLEWRDEQAMRTMWDEADPVSFLRNWVAAAARNQETLHITELQVSLSADATSADHPLHTYLEERYAFIVEFLRRALASLGERGLLRAGVEPLESARMLVALTDGIQIQWLLDRDGVDMAAIVRRHIAALLTVDF